MNDSAESKGREIQGASAPKPGHAPDTSTGPVAGEYEPTEVVSGPGTDRGGRDIGMPKPVENAPEESHGSSQRSGRIDIEKAEDTVEEAGQESFPASDPPAK